MARFTLEPPTQQAGARFVLEAPVSAPPADRQRLLSSKPMRLAKGGKDQIDGLAQLAANVLPSGIVNAVNSAADFVGGEGTFLGDVLGIKGMTPQQINADIAGSNQEYEAARQATAPTTLDSLVTGKKDPGFDAMRLLGNIASPANAAFAKVLPTPGLMQPVMATAGKGAVAGIAGGLSQPVMDEGNYAAQKALQVGIGAAGGAIAAPILSRATESVARLVRNKLATTGAASLKTPEALQMEIRASLAQDDIDIGQIPKGVLAKLTDEVNQSLKKGQELNAPALLRQLDFDRVGVKPTLGQLTRDPTQYAKELNLRGINGAGEPLANRFNEQSSAVSGKLRRGAAGATDDYTAGAKLTEGLAAKNKAMEADVRASYKAFKDATGKDLEVPLGGLAQDYAQIVRDYGGTIPGAVRSQFEELGLLGGKQLKLLSIDDAERLIKTINKNYNPSDRAQVNAMGELRNAVQKSILEVTDSGAGMEAASLANMARGTAADRFRTIDANPALKAVINGAEPDDFVRKYVIGGKVREIQDLAKLVGPDGQKTMQAQVANYLQNKAFGPNAAGDGMFSQAAFNKELNQLGRPKLEALLGPSATDDLFALGRVMSYIQQRPAGAAVNESNTGAAVANILGRIGGTIKGAPYINDFVVKPLQGFKDRGLAREALAAKLPSQAAKLDPETIDRLARLMQPAPLAAGAAAAYSVR